MSLKVVSVSGFANVGMGDVRVYGAGTYDTLFIFTNNSNDNARNTVTSFTKLAKYYADNGLKTNLYGTGVGDTQINPVLRNLSIAAFQCNPIVMWLRGSQLDPAYLSTGKYYSPEELDTLMRSSIAHDRTLDKIPIYGSTPTTPATSTTPTTSTGTTTGSTTPSGGSTTTGSTANITPLAPINNSTSSTSSNSNATATPLAPIAPASTGGASTQGFSGSASQDNIQMSTGSVAGISVGVIGGVALVAALAFWYYTKKRKNQVTPRTFFE